MKHIIAIIIAIIAASLTSCRSGKVIPTKTETTVETRTEYRDRLVRDTVFQHDSVFMHIKDDIVTINKVRYKYVEHTRIDTAFVLNTDSIYIEKPLLVEKQLTWYQKLRLSLFPWMLIVILTIVGYFIKKLI